jgi:hypothetical protein
MVLQVIFGLNFHLISATSQNLIPNGRILLHFNPATGLAESFPFSSRNLFRPLAAAADSHEIISLKKFPRNEAFAAMRSKAVRFFF